MAAVRGGRDRPSDPAVKSALRSAHLERTTAAKAAAFEAAGRCAACTLTPRYCICAELRPLPVRHAVTVVVHPCERTRASSTHRLLVASLPRCTARVWGGVDAPDLPSVWSRACGDADAAGQVPVILYPSPDAVTPAQLYETMTEAQVNAGLHIIVLDGTWSNVRPMIRELRGMLSRGHNASPTASRACVSGVSAAAVAPAGVAEASVAEAGVAAGASAPSQRPVRCVVVTPRQAATLFSAAREQPTPGRVSTLEAVALLLDEAVAAETAARRKDKRLAAEAQRSQPDAESTPAPLARYFDAEPISGPEHLYNGSNPLQVDGNPRHAPRSYAGNRLRYSLMVLVDAVVAQCGSIGAKQHGVGYRTWTLGGHDVAYRAWLRHARGFAKWGYRARAHCTPEELAVIDGTCGADGAAAVAPPRLSSGLFGRLPAHLVIAIAVAAYGPRFVRPNGYTPRRSIGCPEWAALDRDDEHALGTRAASSGDDLRHDAQCGSSVAQHVTVGDTGDASIIGAGGTSGDDGAVLGGLVSLSLDWGVATPVAAHDTAVSAVVDQCAVCPMSHDCTASDGVLATGGSDGGSEKAAMTEAVAAPRRRSRRYINLPPSDPPFTAVPLAHTGRELFALLGGNFGTTTGWRRYT